VQYGPERFGVMRGAPTKHNRPYSRLMKYDHDKALLNGPTALLVFVALCRLHSDARPDEKSSFPAGAAAIAKHSGLTARCVKKHLPRLVDLGLVAIQSGRKIDGQKYNEENRFTLLSSESGSLGREPDARVMFPVSAVDKEKRKRKAVERFNPKELPLPHGEQFASAWREFCTHRGELGRKLTPTATKRILNELGCVEEAEAVRATNEAISRSWLKPFPKASATSSPVLGRAPKLLVL
jgi:hypothetical protein